MNTDFAGERKLKFKIVNFDTAILIAYLLLCLFGLYMNLNISSVTESNMMTFFKQAAWTILAFLTMLYAFAVIDIKKLRKFIPFLTLLNIILLILVLFFGKEINGAKRSFSIAGVNFQPSLFVRIMLVLYFANFLDKKKELISSTYPRFFLKHFKPLIVLTFIVFGVILMQRHFSAIIISSVTIFSLLWIARIRLVTMGLICSIIFVLGMTVLLFGPAYRSHRMEIYQKYSLFHHAIGKNLTKIEADDYQVKQSLISMYAGGFFGVSPLYGQAKNYFLPEATTDYIFSVVGEEYGFLGALLIFGLYCVIFFRGLFGSWERNDFFLKLVGIGLTLNIFYNALVNIGVAMSALPSTGVTLPFMSYGGTSLMANSFSIGLILNITAERRTC